MPIKMGTTVQSVVIRESIVSMLVEVEAGE